MIHHIGLQIVEEDLRLFYQNILGCTIKTEFLLPKEEAFQIFKVDTDVKIVYTQCDSYDLELFIANVPKAPSFNHACIYVPNHSEIAIKAQNAGFNVYVREKNMNSKTYFVSDSNHNLFEIKKK